MNRFFLCLLVAGTSVTCQAQTLYRCANTFSQTPCGTEDQTTFKARGSDPGAVQSHADRVSSMKAACETWIRTVPAWKDRGSVIISEITRGESTVTKVDGVSAIVIPYYAKVNAKNSYGGYVGETVYICHANAQESRIIRGM